jgi:DNA polymerase V
MLLHPSLAPARGFNPSQGNPAGGHQPRYYLPLYAHKVPAGFPSPAEEYAEGSLDLNDYLVPDPGATTFVRVPDAALRGLGIREGDLLVVNRGRAACSGRLVWAEIEGQCLLRELRRHGPRVWLRAHHPDFPPIRPRAGQELRILGVVTAMVRALYPVAPWACSPAACGPRPVGHLPLP